MFTCAELLFCLTILLLFLNFRCRQRRNILNSQIFAPNDSPRNQKITIFRCRQRRNILNSPIYFPQMIPPDTVLDHAQRHE